MTLLQIRTQVAKVSGRYDLVNPTTFADLGMDFYIGAAQKFLDGLTDLPQSAQELSVDLAAGEYAVSLPGVRAIEGVVAIKLTPVEGEDDPILGEEYGLDRVQYMDLRVAMGGVGQLASADRSAPTVYTLVPLRSTSPTATTEGNRGIWVWPPVDGDYRIVVQGLTWSPELTAADDVSFWSVVHPELLVLATLHQLEVFYRNSQGANDYLSQIMQLVRNLDNDTVSEAIANADVMADTW